jgi:uncharacterized protein (DUF2235 family)
MPKNIVICCDGTGNEVGAREYSNVAKLYIRLDKSDDTRQVAYYDPGLGTLGTPGFRTRTVTSITRIMGLALGYGLHDNIKDAYLCLMNQYEEGDKIFLFGFSRGAYTVRALAGMIDRCGLLKRGSENLVEHAIKRYFERIRTKRKEANRETRGAAKDRNRAEPDWKGMARFKKHFGQDCDIHFIGVWDTVKSVGILRRSLALPGTANLAGVKHGRHAVALNEKRSKYRPNLWSHPRGEDFSQVWFAGVHSDVGGGYENSGLSDIALKWMICEAVKFDLRLIPEWLDSIKPEPLAKKHNPLWPFWWLLGWRRRSVVFHPSQIAWVHDSVKTRCQHDSGFAKQCNTQIPGNSLYVSTDCAQQL